MPVHPSLVFHDLVKRLGNIVPTSPKDVTIIAAPIRAGYRNDQALKILYGAKVLFGNSLPVTVGLLLSKKSSADPRIS